MTTIKGSQLTAEVCQVTPQVAAHWLSTNKKNRRVSLSRVNRYAKAIREGEWRIAQPIMFNCDGSLIDGQHRLRAVMTANRPVEFLVLKGFDPEETFAKIDEVQPRRLAHWLEMRGEAEPETLAKLITMANRDEAGLIPVGAGHGFIQTPQEGLEFLERHPELRVSVKAPGTFTTLTPHSLLCFCHWKFSRKDKSLAQQFLIDLVTGEFNDGDPVSLLRERLKSNRHAKAKLTRVELLALFYKAWNAERRGEPIRQLKWTSAGNAAEKFPEVE